MANNLTTQSTTLATIPDASEIETYDTGDGHRQVVAVGASGSTAFTDPAPGTSATLVLAANADRKVAVIQNAGTVDCYIGPSGVTTSTGLELVAGAAFVDDASVSAWYGITASGTADVRVCEVT
jgi:hypothetical protein